MGATSSAVGSVECRKRVLLAGLFHETNTFLPGLTTLRDFQVRHGTELLGAEGDGSPLDGVMEVARGCGWRVVPAIDMRATPGPTVEDAVVERFWKALKDSVECRSDQAFDGVLLVLHGAMVSQSLEDVEGEILRRLRTLPALSTIPVCGVLDLHANFTDAMADLRSGFVAYRQNPHADAREAAANSARLLDRIMRSGERPITVRGRPPIMWPPSGTGTADEPMQTLERMARDMEAADPDLLAVNVFGGFPYADCKDAGVCFSAVTVGDPETARAALQKLVRAAMDARAGGVRIGMDLEVAIRRLARHREGPVLIVESADNIGAGSPGDCTPVLEAFITHGIDKAGVIINDPTAVRLLADHAIGASVRVGIGGKSGVPGAVELALEVEILSRSDGRLVLEDKQSHMASMCGKSVDMGPCAVVRHAGTTILLTSRRTPPFDLGQWRSQGINPEHLFAIGVKAAVAHRRAYDPIAKASYSVETAGPCAGDLRRLPFRRVARLVYPLDEV